MDSFLFSSQPSLQRSVVLQQAQEKGKISQRGIKSPRTMMPLVLGFWLADRTWERLGKRRQLFVFALHLYDSFYLLRRFAKGKTLKTIGLVNVRQSELSSRVAFCSGVNLKEGLASFDG